MRSNQLSYSPQFGSTTDASISYSWSRANRVKELNATLMVRNNRQLTRLFFVLVIAMGLFGAQYARVNWRPDVARWNASSTAQATDWVDLLARLGEETIQLFLGLTSER